MQKTAATHDFANGGTDTQNVRGGSVTYTFHGTLNNGSSLVGTISSSAVLATDVIVGNTAGPNGGATSGTFTSFQVHDGGFKFYYKNTSGGTIANDSTVIINWIAL